MNDMSEGYPETASKILDSCNAVTEDIYNQKFLEYRARLDVVCEKIMEKLETYSSQPIPEPLDLTSNQTQESDPIHQVNQIVMP